MIYVPLNDQLDKFFKKLAKINHKTKLRIFTFNSQIKN